MHANAFLHSSTAKNSQSVTGKPPYAPLKKGKKLSRQKEAAV